MSMDLSEFQDGFFEEADEHTAMMEESLLTLEEQPENPEPLQRIFRAAHTIKGGSGMFGFTAVVDFTHRMEALLDELRNERIGVTKAVIDLLLEATDGVKSLLKAAQTKDPVDAQHIHDVTTRLEACLTEGRAESSPAIPLEAAAPDAAPGPQRLGEILVADGVISPETLTQALHTQQQHGAAASAGRPVESLKVERAESTSIRVETTKIDKVINLVGELVITQAMISDLGTGFDMSKVPLLQERIAQLEQNTRELQDHVMSIRMMPIGTVFQRFPRLVRDLAASTHKKVKLVVSGEETELDKTVVESIGDPLTHLIRNAVDHAIETPDVRVAAGKPEQGTVRLNAYHQGGNIFIEVQDDGTGLDREKILRKARQQGLLAESETPPDDQLWRLIFEPGFSTAEQVTDVSGRGVGMDVVQRNIKALGGTVSITTERGQGTTFRLKLPLTLAIIEGLTVRVGAEIYIVPLMSILESVRPQRSWLKTVVGRGEIVDLRGDIIPIARLYRLLGCSSEVTDPVQGLLIIVESEGQRGAILVDDILGQQQVVIKSLEQNFRKIAGIAGATILGNGQAAFILDVHGLLELAMQGGYGGGDECRGGAREAREEARDDVRVGAET